MVQTSPTPFDVGRAFVHQYYTLLHQAPHMLHRFYSTDSTFIHGGVDRPGCVEQPAVGPENISQRINDLNLRDCHAKIRQVDSHPTIGEGVVVQVTGELSNNGDPMRRFMQTFVLAPRQPKKYYVQNDIFRYQDEVFDDGSDEVDEDDRSSSHIYGDCTSNADKASNADSSAAVVGLSQQPLLMTAPVRSTPLEEQQALPPRNAVRTLAGNQQQTGRQQENQHTGSTNLNGFSTANVGESTGYGEIGHSHVQQPEPVQSHSQSSPRPLHHQIAQENPQQTNGGNVPPQQPVKQTVTTQQQQQQQQPVSTTETPRSEEKSYAGITKLHSSAGPTINVSSTTATAPRIAPTPTPTPPSNVQQANSIGRPSVKIPPTTTSRPSSNPQSGQQSRSGGNYHQQNSRGTNVSTAPNEQQVFVGSLPAEFTKETLIECFSKFGKVLDAKIQVPSHDNKKSFGFVVFENPEIATHVVSLEHVMCNDTIRLNVEPKTQRNYQSNNNLGGNYNGPQGGGRNSIYQGRSGGRGGNRAPYRGGGNSQRRGGGGQFNNHSPSFNGGDEINNEYRTTKVQQPIQQQ